jgi:hypothetical protein
MRIQPQIPISSGALQVRDPNQLATLLTNELRIDHSGFLHNGACPERSEWVSNGSSKGVNFDSSCGERFLSLAT